MLIASILNYMPVAAGVIGLSYISYVGFQDASSRARAWVPLAGWTLLGVFLIMFAAVTLFMDFVNSSDIPLAMQYFAEKSIIRNVSDEQKKLLVDELHKIKDQVPQINLVSDRQAESLQYATEILDALKIGGVKVILRGQEQSQPDPEDFFSTTIRGVLIGTRFGDAPTRAAILFMRAFSAARLNPHYITITGSQPEDITIIIGPK